MKTIATLGGCLKGQSQRIYPPKSRFKKGTFSIIPLLIRGRGDSNSKTQLSKQVLTLECNNLVGQRPMAFDNLGRLIKPREVGNGKPGSLYFRNRNDWFFRLNL